MGIDLKIWQQVSKVLLLPRCKGQNKVKVFFEWPPLKDFTL